MSSTGRHNGRLAGHNDAFAQNCRFAPFFRGHNGTHLGTLLPDRRGAHGHGWPAAAAIVHSSVLRARARNFSKGSRPHGSAAAAPSLKLDIKLHWQPAELRASLWQPVPRRAKHKHVRQVCARQTRRSVHHYTRHRPLQLRQSNVPDDSR